MKITRFVIRTLLIYILSATLLVCIVFLPSDVRLHFDNNSTIPKLHIPWETYIHDVKGYFSQLSKGELGLTKSQTSVADELKRVVPRTIKIILPAFFIIMVFGVLKGIYDYRNSNRWTRWFGDRLTSLTQSFPDFFFIMAIVWIILFYLPFIDVFAYEKWYGFILPALIVALYPLTFVAKITAGALAQEKGEQYVQVSHSKGLKEKAVVYRHMLQNSIGTVLSHLSSIMLLLISNLIILELFLDYKGAAYRLFFAVPTERELIVAIALVFMTIVFATQIVAYLLRIYLDPRERGA
ncbi:ABC transporter permease subunit [Cytobacillus suaedae]|nr:ABC transporter permease subunit [Cytobacillus suaedae]